MQLLGIQGFKRCGKNTLGDMLAKIMGTTTRMAAFGDTVKQISHTISGIPLAVFYDDNTKDVPWEDTGVIPREVMTKVNDGLRPVFGDDLFIDPLKPVWRESVIRNEALIITDVRYENEAAWIRKEGGTIIHLLRPGCVAGDHSSEKGIIYRNGYDYRIVNDGTMDDLRCQAHAFMNWWVGPDLGP